MEHWASIGASILSLIIGCGILVYFIYIILFKEKYYRSLRRNNDNDYFPNLKVWGFVLVVAVIFLIIPIIIKLLDPSIDSFAVLSWPNIMNIFILVFIFAFLVLIILAIIKIVRDD